MIYQYCPCVTHQGFYRAHSWIASTRMLKNHETPPNCMHGLFLAGFHHQILGISRMTSSSQQHVLFVGVFKRLPDSTCFLLHTCVTFFSGMVLACVGAQVELQSDAICPFLWQLKHSILFINKKSWRLLAKLLLGDWWVPLYLSLWYALQSFAMWPNFVQE